jgi:mannose-6-phosphate isomerase-like protein (cupin superfamily)
LSIYQQCARASSIQAPADFCKVQIKKKAIFRHDGEELLYVLEGTMKFLHDNREYIVEEGDCIYFDSSLPHFGESMGNKKVRCLMVIYNQPGR